MTRPIHPPIVGQRAALGDGLVHVVDGTNSGWNQTTQWKIACWNGVQWSGGAHWPGWTAEPATCLTCLNHETQLWLLKGRS